MEMRSLDAYSLKTRYYPTVILLAPLCLVVFSIGSGVWDPIKGLASAIVSTLGLAFIMDQIGRDQGKKKEARLFLLWGGKPTTRIFRHRDSILDPVTLKRYHIKLAEIVEGIHIPSPEEEAANPAAADSIYESCAAYLRQKTRGVEFPLVYQENTNYGFRRNLWGMKATGIALSILGAFGCATLAAWYFVEGKEEWLVAVICALVCIVIFVLWTFRFTPSWVRIPAEEYARQLASACDSIDNK
mgnify:CR=1 FL=1